MASTTPAAASSGMARRRRSVTSGCDASRAAAAAPPVGRREDLGRRRGVECSDEGGQPAGVEVVDGRPWRPELHGVAAPGGEVEVGPGDGVLAHPLGEAVPTQTAHDRSESDVHGDQLEALGRGAGEDHVGDTGQAVSDDIDHLGVGHVANEEELVVVEGGVGPIACVLLEVGLRPQEHAGVLEALDEVPGQEEIGPASPTHEQTLDERRPWSAEADRQVRDLADVGAVGCRHCLACFPAQRQHFRSMDGGGLRRRFSPVESRSGVWVIRWRRW